MQSPIRRHPNALTALISGTTIGSGVCYAAQHWIGWKLSSQTGLYIGTGVAAVVLFIGSKGFVGVWRFLKFGADGK